MSETTLKKPADAPKIEEKEPLFGKKERRLLTDPLDDNNPITVQVLGICSALAVTTLVIPSVVISVAVVFVCAPTTTSPPPPWRRCRCSRRRPRRRRRRQRVRAWRWCRRQPPLARPRRHPWPAPSRPPPLPIRPPRSARVTWRARASTRAAVRLRLSTRLATGCKELVGRRGR